MLSWKEAAHKPIGVSCVLIPKPDHPPLLLFRAPHPHSLGFPYKPLDFGLERTWEMDTRLRYISVSMICDGKNSAACSSILPIRANGVRQATLISIGIDGAVGNSTRISQTNNGWRKHLAIKTVKTKAKCDDRFTFTKQNCNHPQ